MAQQTAAYNEWELIEEAANVLTHGLGLALSIVGMVFLLMMAYPDPLRLFAVGIFGFSLILLYSASTLYHAVTDPALKRSFQVFDHCAIYVLIAGTYTPITLVVMEEAGWNLFLTVWTIAFLGIFFKLFFTNRFRIFSTLLYLAMGWLVVLFGPSVVEMLPPGGLALLVCGGLSYTLGTLVYLYERHLFNHAIWHLFVLTGSVFHYFTIYYYVL